MVRKARRGNRRELVESLEARRLLSAWAAHINMEPAGSAVPTGYLADVGLPFGDRGNGYSYGWDTNVTADARDRNMVADQRYDTLIHTQKNGANHVWEIAVPNGTYSVHLVAGDAGFIDSVFRFNAEGTLILSGTPSAAKHWVEATANVTVNDGRLTISNASGAYNNKIDYIDITAVTPPSPPPVVSSQPFHGTPVVVGRPIEAEDYDLGGEGVAYHDTTSANLGGAYRKDGVDVQAGGSNGYDVGYTAAGEWLKYTISVPQTGSYAFTARVACAGTGGTFHAEIDGVNVTGSLRVPNTVGWLDWNTISGGRINLTAGTHVMRIVMDSNSSTIAAVGNFDAFNLTPIIGPAKLNWTSGTASPVGRFEGYGRVLDGKLYAFGGYTSIDPFTSSQDYGVYDPETGSWTDLGTMPIPETHADIAEDDSTDTLYFVGGLRGTYPGTPVSDVWAFHADDNTWQQLPSLPQPLGGGTADLVNGEIHYFGGIGTSSRSLDLSVHYVLKLGDSQWQTASPLPVARDHMSSVVLNGIIYIFGGEIGHDTDHLQQTLTQMYDPATDSWTQLAAMPQGKSHMESSTFVWNGKVILAGGQTDNYQSTNTMLQYDPATNSWSMLAPLPMALQGVIVQPLDGQLITTCGYDGLIGVTSKSTWFAPWS